MLPQRGVFFFISVATFSEIFSENAKKRPDTHSVTGLWGIKPLHFAGIFSGRSFVVAHTQRAAVCSKASSFPPTGLKLYIIKSTDRQTAP